MTTQVVTTAFRVYAGETLSFVNETAFYLQEAYPTPPPVLTIEGTVVVTGASGAFGSLAGISIGSSGFYNSTVTIASTGVLRVTATSGSALGYGSGSWSPDFVNHGLVEISGAASATGLSTWDAGPWLFENTGTFRVTSSGGSAGGVSLVNGGTFRNTNLIEVTGKTAIGVALNGWESSFYNYGTIKALDGGAAADSVAMSWTSSFGTGDKWENWGWLEGDYALRASSYSSFSSSNELFTNHGTMVGRVDLGPSSGRLVNNGMIWGDTALGLGDDLFDGRIGVTVGAVTGGDGADTILGGARGDTLSGDGGNDSIDGGGGDDVISGGRDGDMLFGGDGVDTLSFADATVGVSVNLETARAISTGEDTISGFERVLGGAFADSLTGTAGADTLSGGGGADFLVGALGDDSLDGGAGDDILIGENGSDTLSGGDGSDQISGGDGLNLLIGGMGNDSLLGGAGADSLDGGEGADQLIGGAGGDSLNGGAGVGFLRGEDGDDTLMGGADFDDLHGNKGDDFVRGGEGDDWVVGGQGNDVLFGDAGADIVLGNLGSDTCEGGAGADTIRGGQSDDMLSGGAGDDWLSGDLGSDTVSGGAGADIFHSFAQAGADVVTDFNAAEGDRVMLDPGTVYVVDQVGADVVINMANNNYVVLLGVQLSSLPAGWLYLG